MAEAAGSFRRGKETVARPRLPRRHHRAGRGLPTPSPPARMSPCKSSPAATPRLPSASRAGCNADLRAVASKEEFPFALNYFTGSKEHNIAYAPPPAHTAGTLNEDRLSPTKAGQSRRPSTTSTSISTALLGLDYDQPELREKRGRSKPPNENPSRVSSNSTNLRGAFHNHTIASDGTRDVSQKWPKPPGTRPRPISASPTTQNPPSRPTDSMPPGLHQQIPRTASLNGD